MPTALQDSRLGDHARPRQRAWLRPTYLWLLIPALLCYLALAFTISSVKAPWVDEGWIASAPGNWALTGHVGTPTLDPTGSWLNAELTGIHEYTYWNLPASLVAQGLWFKLFGFSVLSMRSLSILWGLLALLSWFVIVTRLSGSGWAGSIAVALLAVDYTFLWGAADGRMDMMCAALGSAGLAVFLALREGHWTAALSLANVGVALAVFTHPNGLEWFLLLAFLVLYFDRRRLHWSDAVVFTPYFACAVLWGLYILRRPDYFLAQIAANGTARGGARWAALMHPIQNVVVEIGRYLIHYGVDPIWGGPVPNYAILIPFLYWIALLGAWFYAPVRKDRKLLALLCLNGLQIAWMTWFEGLKLPNYLVAILPSYAGLFAVWVWLNFRNKRPYAAVTAIFAISLVLCQVGVVISKIRMNAYQNEYLPTVRFLRQNIPARPGAVIADSYFAFELGLHNVTDDARVGYYSGRRAEYVVRDYWYGSFWHNVFAVEEPEVARYIQNELDTHYAVVFEDGPYRVFKRRTSGEIGAR